MAIPDYEELMLPVLRIADDGEEHRISDVIQRLAESFQLSAEERHPSSKLRSSALETHIRRHLVPHASDTRQFLHIDGPP
jgi:restriction endonuclease Mrr